MKDALQLIKEKIGEYKTSAVFKIISRITWEGPLPLDFMDKKLINSSCLHLCLA